MSMNTPIGNITQTTPIKDFKELDEMQNEQRLLGIDNNAVGNGSKISLKNLINSLISTDDDNLITKGTDDRLLVNTPVEIGDLSDLTTTNKSTLVAAINEVDSDITAEATIRQNADNNLQSQIDAITAASDVTDIVGTYAELQAYDTVGLPDKSIIKVLQDESRQNKTTYYRWVITGGVGTWVLVGEEGPYYTISQSDSKFATIQNVGNLSNLDTSDKSSIVNAINELSSVLDPTQTADYIKNSKGLESGEISNNASILPWIKEMFYSTYVGDQPSNASPLDSKKFIKVGTPIITDDGVASGFSSNNYLTGATGYALGNDFEIEIEYTVDSNFSANTRFDMIRFQSGGEWAGHFYSKSGTATLLAAFPSYETGVNSYEVNISPTLTVGNKYYSKLVVKNGTMTGYYRVNDGALTQAASIPTNFNATAIINSFKIGYGGAVWSGSIDLKGVKITVDGVPVFSGNKTGIDTIKPDNYTVVGTPTISADGVASGFSDNDYLKTPTFDFSKPWGIIGQFKLSSAPTANFPIIKIIGRNYSNIAYYEYSSNRILFNVYTSSSLGQYQEYSLSANIDYNYKFGWSGTEYYFEMYQGNNRVVNLGVSSTEAISISDQNRDIVLGYYPDVPVGSSWNVLPGSIDLNAFKIYVNGNLVYQPCLKIPYTESKTGSKIVDSIYRDRVDDMYEQFGYAPYYTLSDNNFTLPMGDIYGGIERKQTYYGWRYIAGDGTLISNAKAVSSTPYDITDNIKNALPKNEGVFECMFCLVLTMQGRENKPRLNTKYDIYVDNTRIIQKSIDTGGETSSNAAWWDSDTFVACFKPSVNNMSINIYMSDMTGDIFDFSSSRLFLVAYRRIK